MNTMQQYYLYQLPIVAIIMYVDTAATCTSAFTCTPVHMLYLCEQLASTIAFSTSYTLLFYMILLHNMRAIFSDLASKI